MQKQHITHAINAAVAVALLVLVGMERIGWEQALVGLGLLFAPSSVTALRVRK